jgi:hypothetical protein
VIERRSIEPLVRLSIFRVRTVRAANVAMFFVAAGLFAMFFFMTRCHRRGSSPALEPSCGDPTQCGSPEPRAALRPGERRTAMT